MKKASNPQPPEVQESFSRVSLQEVKRAFTEWDRRFREEPERFESEATHLLKGNPETYGDACAPYFMQLVEDVKSGKIS